MHTDNEVLRISTDTLLAEVETLLGQGNAVTLQVTGRSMLPFLVEGRDSVVLRQMESLEQGDIVLAHLSQGYVLHRIYHIDDNIESDTIRLMGDGNLYAQEICCRKNICAKATAMIRNGKTVDCTSRKERIKAWIWMRLLPVRRYLLWMYYLRKKLRE